MISQICLNTCTPVKHLWSVRSAERNWPFCLAAVPQNIAVSYTHLDVYKRQSQTILLDRCVHVAVQTPEVLLPLVWPLPRSLATTSGISVDFSLSLIHISPNPIKQPNIVPSTARYRAVHAPERNIENFGFSCSSIACLLYTSPTATGYKTHRYFSPAFWLGTTPRLPSYKA